MPVRSFRILFAPLAVLMLAGFRMPPAEEVAERMLYDVRGAFVTAQPDVPHLLIAQTDILVDAAIRATNRSIMLPRTILTVRIGETKQVPQIFGKRFSASVVVKAISVGSGETVAEGSFETSVRVFGNDGAEASLAERIAERVASEFRLEAPRRSAVVTAFESRRP